MPSQALQLHTIEGGGVTAAAGFRADGVHAGFRRDPQRLDLALVESDRLCSAAGVFTRNAFCAAPVIVSREHLDGCGYGLARAVVINSGTANAATGPQGLDRARSMAAITAEAVGCAEEDVLVASTGVIGQQLPLEPFTSALPGLHATVSAEGGAAAARAIMTTDTVPKERAVTYVSSAPGLEGARITVGGMVKGSGMIMPDMATMISVVTTDAPVAPEAAHAALRRAVGVSFNKVTVDSDTSTNDTCFLLCSAASAPDAQPIGTQGLAFEEFVWALSEVCGSLARQIAADGEGATRLITVNVSGAATPADADAAARAIANSPLVKTAVYGHDCNWGRIAAAVGKSGAAFRQEDVDIDIMGIEVCRGGLPLDFDEDEALARFDAPEVVIDVALGAGDDSTTMWTCDFSHEYVSINGDYRS